MNIEKRIAIVGLGYVGLALAMEFGKRYDTLGFDINTSRVSNLQQGKDSNLEASLEQLTLANRLTYSSNAELLKNYNIFIIAVPTPLDRFNRPDLTHLKTATQIVGKVIRPSSLVIYESTVYPGCTEEVCIPIIEEISGLKLNQDFFCGYSPERINPGDKSRKISSITKITSGSTPEIAEFVDELYNTIIVAGTHKASSIKVAEAAKVVENTQRDMNIALVNELSMIFKRLNIDTVEVLKAAETKWNFIPVRPGLVGGHCIGVDSYYLAHKAQELGYHPEVILSGRRINDTLARYVADETIGLMLRKKIGVLHSRILVLGISFKENCPDIRNSKVVDVVKRLIGYNAIVDVYDPWVCPDTTHEEYGIECMKQEPCDATYDAIIIAVAHQEFINWGITRIRAFGRSRLVVFDVKSIFPKESADIRL